MPTPHHSRREFLSAAALASGAFAYRILTAPLLAQEKPRSSLERLGIGAIGMRYQGSVIAHQAQMYGDVVAVCDVDRNVRDQAKAALGSTPLSFEDYRELLERKDVDVVCIGAPDHWHAKMAIDACRAGKDVYVEKPLTLTIDEGKLLGKVAQETGQVVQVGSWQRSDHRFRLAVEMVRQGRIGTLQHVDVVLGKNEIGGPFPPRPVPRALNWNLWQGQTLDVPYCEERCHYTFRWWYEYAGGQMTDWGAHHLDIAQWAINSLPVEIDGKGTFPQDSSGFNVATGFQARYRYASGVMMTVSDTGRNGIIFSGDRGRIFVNRGSLEGKPVEELSANPLPREKLSAYAHDNFSRPQRAGKLDAIINHMGNFFDCVASRRPPISDVASQHNSATACHLGNISMRLGRPLRWDPQQERFVNDSEADNWLARPQRAGFEVA